MNKPPTASVHSAKVIFITEKSSYLVLLNAILHNKKTKIITSRKIVWGDGCTDDEKDDTTSSMNGSKKNCKRNSKS